MATSGFHATTLHLILKKIWLFDAGLKNFFLHLSLPPVFLQLVFQPFVSAQTGFLIRAWEPSGLDY